MDRCTRFDGNKWVLTVNGVEITGPEVDKFAAYESAIPFERLAEVAQITTNADRIRTLSNEELAAYLCAEGWSLSDYTECLDWLKRKIGGRYDG